MSLITLAFLVDAVRKCQQETGWDLERCIRYEVTSWHVHLRLELQLRATLAQ